MEDIAPGLLEKIRASFIRNIQSNEEIQALNQAIESGAATYTEAEQFGIKVGEALADAFGEHLSSANLPHGKLFYNIADRVVRPLLEEDFELVANAAAEVQKALNQKAGIHIKALTATVDADRVDGIIESLVKAEQYDDIAWLLEEPLVNFSLGAVTETLRVNFEFHGKSGLNPKVIRKCEAKACKWCRSLAGTYSYFDDFDRNVFRRHQRCRCTVLYDPGNGKLENVHSKKLVTTRDIAERESRQIIGMRTSNGTTVKGVSKHAIDQLTTRGVTADRMKDALAHPLTVTETQYDKLGRPSFRIIGQKATLTINPKTGKVLTAYPTHTETAKMYKRAKR